MWTRLLALLGLVGPAKGVFCYQFKLTLGWTTQTYDVIYAEMASTTALHCERYTSWSGMHNGVPYHHAGASPAQELACTIATTIAYLRQLPAPDPGAMVLRMAVDTDLYVEIAKLRAARLLFAKVAAGFGCAAVRVGLHAEGSARSWSADDAHTNLLRSNVQAFAASLAGCDSISVAPFEDHQDDRDRMVCRRPWGRDVMRIR